MRYFSSNISYYKDTSVEHWDDKKGSTGMTGGGATGMTKKEGTGMTTKGYFHDTFLVGSNHSVHAVVSDTG
ncbi:MAG: hypothetical protein LBU02_04795 [Rickettsiales bacterium]|jgi:hypothetical protein|nr:hypothetical protein [Rickettsiales bacterium]